MNINCSKESLLKAVGIAESVISTKNSISILSNVLLEATEGKLKISACETKLNFYADIGADIIEPGSISLHCNKFYSIIKKLPGEEISIHLASENMVHIKPTDNEKINYTLKGIGADKFPPVKNIEDSNFFTVTQQVFSEMTKKTIFAISQNENRRFVNGVFFEIKNNNIQMVATDGKRLSFIKNEIALEDNLDQGIIIPLKVLTEVLKLCSDNGDVQIAINNKNIFIKINNFSFISNLLEGNFPPYEKVIPEEQPLKIILNRKDIYDSLDRISQISDKESHKINFSLSQNTLKLQSEDITIGSGEEILEIDYSGPELRIFLNYSFLTDVLTVINSDFVIIEFKDEQSTVTVHEAENNNFIYIMMPMAS